MAEFVWRELAAHDGADPLRHDPVERAAFETVAVLPPRPPPPVEGQEHERTHVGMKQMGPHVG